VESEWLERQKQEEDCCIQEMKELKERQ